MLQHVGKERSEVKIVMENVLQVKVDFVHLCVLQSNKKAEIVSKNFSLGPSVVFLNPERSDQLYVLAMHYCNYRQNRFFAEPFRDKVFNLTCRSHTYTGSDSDLLTYAQNYFLLTRQS